VDAALREAACDEPKARLRGSREHVAQFLSIAESPNRADAAGNIIPEQFADQMLLPLVACRQHDQVGGERSPLRMSAPAATKAAISENCANPISPLTIRSEQPILK